MKEVEISDTFKLKIHYEYECWESREGFEEAARQIIDDEIYDPATRTHLNVLLNTTLLISPGKSGAFQFYKAIK